MTRVWFVVPAHGRERLAAVCLRQLARVCEAAGRFGIDATAVVVADDQNIHTARGLGFATVRRDNTQLGRKFNDGFQLACDPAYNPEPADFVIPCGSDDLIDITVLQRLPAAGRIGIFRDHAVVDETRTRLAFLHVGYKAGCGIRIIPRAVLEPCGYRPAAEDRGYALDSSIYEGLKHAHGRAVAVVELDQHPLQIVDIKSSGQQLHPYTELAGFRRGPEGDPWTALAQVFPEAVAELRELRA